MSIPSPGPRVIFCPVGMDLPLKLLALPGGGVRKSLMDRRSFWRLALPKLIFLLYQRDNMSYANVL